MSVEFTLFEHFRKDMVSVLFGRLQDYNKTNLQPALHLDSQAKTSCACALTVASSAS